MSTMWMMAIFIIFTLILIYISRTSLRNRRSHGFYRFFAWEAILALIVIDVPVWFSDWLAWYQIISWFLFSICLIPLGFGLYYLITRGSPDKEKRSEAHLLGFEKTTVLVTSGIYHFIRHPLYSSLFFLDLGVFFKKPSVAGVLLAVAAAFFLIMTSKGDEEECLRVFGREYQEYMKTTRRFIPLIY